MIGAHTPCFFPVVLMIARDANSDTFLRHSNDYVMCFIVAVLIDLDSSLDAGSLWL